MRLLILLALLLAAPATAGVLEVTCVAPVNDNDSGSCDSTIAVPRWGNLPMTIHLTWRSVLRGGAFGHDSLTVSGGDTLTFSRWLPGGDYYAAIWAADAGGAGCRTEWVESVRGWPGMVKRVKP